ncbi:methyltransferase-like protein 13 [Ditylenchus destructor]|nr:methyltransferase-like protein 13 [Ditylenchus destructor]
MIQRVRLSRPARYLCNIILLSLLILYAIKVYNDLFPGYIIDDRYVNGIDSKESASIVKIDTMCSEISKELCFSVVDLIQENEEVKRAIYLHGFEQEFDTVVALIPPKGMSASNSDTRMWEVNHNKIMTQYVSGLVLAPFMVGALNPDQSLEDRVNQSMCIVGLGGGAVDSFIHAKFPKINITVLEVEPVVKILANRWFGVLEDKTRRTIIRDGIEVIKDAKRKGESYNVVMVDACNSDDAMPCPSPRFIEQESLELIKSVLKPMGAFVLNTLAMKDEISNIQMVQQRLLTVFPLCISISAEEEFNTIFACLPYSIQPQNRLSTQKLWFEQRRRIQKEFKLDMIQQAPITIIERQ